MKNLNGSMVALVTPFSNGSLDEEAYKKLIAFQLENGTNGLVPIGTTGEAATMSAEERFRAVKLAVQCAAGKVPVVAGAGTNSTRETVENVGRVREAGADAALVVTPYYNKPTQDGLVAHFRAIAKGHPGFPLVAYNVPGRTGVDMLPETCQKLCDIPEVTAIKEATASMIRAVDIVEKCGDRLALLSGDDFTVVPFIACGGVGVISVSANVVPRMMSDLVHHARSGDFAKARALQVKLNPLHRALFLESNPIPVKAAAHVLGLIGAEIRGPLTPMSEGPLAKLKEAMRGLGLS